MSDTKTLDPSPGLSAAGEVPAFPRRVGETPRAFSAFMAYFQLGHARSLSAVADQLGEKPGTVRHWSSKYDWAGRLHAYQSGLLQARACDLAARQLQSAADWDRRLHEFRELEWASAQKLIAAVQCFLENFGDEEVGRMNLAQVARALKVSSAIARSAIAGAELPASAVPEMSPLQQQLLAGVARIYGQPPASDHQPSPSPPQSALVNL